MQPAANIIAYHVSNEKIVYARQKIETKFSYDNYVSRMSCLK